MVESQDRTAIQTAAHSLPELEVEDLKRERDILAAAQGLVKVGAWDWEIDTGDLWWSDEVYRIFGRQPREFKSTYEDFIDHVHPDDRAELESRLEATIAGTRDFDFRHRIVQPDGTVRYVRGRAQAISPAAGRALRMLGTVMDITDETLLQQERDEAVKALAESEARYRLLAENAWDVIWTMDLEGNITYISPSVERMRGLTPAEAAAQKPEEIQPPAAVARAADYYQRLFAAIAAGGELPRFHGEQEYYRKDGSIMYGEVDVVPQVDADGKVLRILGVTRDISEQKRLEEELKYLAVTDPLTGVCNRRHASEILTSAIADSRRYGHPLSMLMLDIDGFKAINDEYGHQVGDRVLGELTGRLAEHLRGSDMLARWGGEEFVIMSGHCNLAAAAAVAEKLRRLIADAPFEGVGKVTISVGVAELEPTDDFSSWIRRADKAMYEAKAVGRNAVRLGR